MDINFEEDIGTSVGDMVSEPTLDNDGEDETWLTRDKSSNDANENVEEKA